MPLTFLMVTRWIQRRVLHCSLQIFVDVFEEDGVPRPTSSATKLRAKLSPAPAPPRIVSLQVSDN